MNHQEGLKDKHVIVTGGSRGLGRAIVEALLAREATVTAIGRDGVRRPDCKNLRKR